MRLWGAYMKTGYDQFFKKARQVVNGNAQPVSLQTTDDVKKQVHSVIKKVKRQRKSAKFPWLAIFVLSFGVAGGFWGYQNLKQVESWLDRIEIGLGTTVRAESSEAEKSASSSSEKTADNSSGKSTEGDVANNPENTTKAEDASYLGKLNERKKELDLREAELKKMEEDLQAQKVELERKIAELDSLRDKISGILQDRVQMDQEKLDKLVQVYSDMKPEQAAKVLDALDEGLAIEIIGRMKKKNAADILNLLKPEKAQMISEKYAGYKR